MGSTCAHCVEPAVALVGGVPGTAGEAYTVQAVCAEHARDKITNLATIVGMSQRGRS